ncbi:MAG: hypothetical protein ACRECQ_00280 [Burkholderiaceae bacterium]
MFKAAVEEIESAYAALGHTQGWRFLCVSKNILDADPSIAFISANPGGNAHAPSHGEASCEKGCAYLAEKWGVADAGQSALQKQVQALFGRIAEEISVEEGMGALMERSLVAYYIPFRSPRLALLQRKDETERFAKRLWSKVLGQKHPKLIITIDHAAFRAFSDLLEGRSDQMIEQQKMMTGWGTYTADVKSFQKDGGITTLLRLPHLSTFKLFSRHQCRPYTDAIVSKACSHLKLR